MINGRSAVLKKDFSFEYICENRLFMGRDGYTLNIVFSLKDCPENIAIFGHINRMDVAKDTVSFECAILDGEVSLFGTLSVVKISEVEAECQFAEGRCSQTLEDPFEDVYVSDLDLGAPAVTDPAAVSPEQAWKGIDQGADEVALPWVNENAPTAPNNWVDYSGGGYSWDAEVSALSWQPYLIVMAKRICDAVGYGYDFSEWEDSGMRHLIVCNTVPGMPQYRQAMPDWTVSEFFGKLELFLMCEFDFDHRDKSVRMRFSKNAIAEIDPVAIDDIVDSYSVEVSQPDDAQCSYMAAKRLAYKECQHTMWNFYSCDWYVGSCRMIKRYPTLAALIDANRRRDSFSGSHRVSWGESMGDGYPTRSTTLDALMYAEDVDTYFVFRSIGTELVGTSDSGDHYTQLYVLQPVNVFGSGSIEDDSVQSEEIEFLPACVMDTFVGPDDDKGYMMFLSPSSGSSDSVAGEGTRPGGGNLDSHDASEVSQPVPASSIAGGRKEKSASYYDDIFVAFWTGAVPEPGKTPYPIVDGMSMVSQDWQDLHLSGLSMRISSGSSLLKQLPQINPAQKFKFSWLDTKIPNPRAIFHIRGKRYLCEKITATFSESGMSQLLKGEFYPLVE